MPPASKKECHFKWCDQMNQAAERLHMTLVEGGERAALVRRPGRYCGKPHLIVRFYGPVPSDEIALRAMKIAWPTEMFEDVVAVEGGPPWRVNAGPAERVR